MSRRNPEAVADTAAEQAKTGPILAHDIYRNNAEVIAYGCVPLGILRPDMRIRDTTYGKGNFWSLWKPDGGLWTPENRDGRLVGSDIVAEKSPVGQAVDGANLRNEAAVSYDAGVIDGPYQLNGTPGGGGPASSNEAYGVDIPAKWQDRHQLIIDMMSAMFPLLDYGAPMLVKMQDQVSQKKLRMQTYIFAKHAIEELGMELTNRFQLEGYRTQPSDKIEGAQKTERSNFSVLHVYRKARR